MDQTTVEQYLRRIREAGDATMRPCSLVTPALRLAPPWRVGIAHLFLRPRFLLADPTGSGKTPTALAAFGYLKEKDPSLKLLVVTTKSAQFQWQRSVDKFLIGQRTEVIGYTDTKKRHSPDVRLARYPHLTDTDIWITTYATLAKDEAHFLTHLNHYVVVLDEAHWIKSHRQDKLYPAALKVSQKARSCWGLSATPVANGRLDELFSVMEIVRPGTFGPALDIDQRYSHFRRTYYLMRLVTPRWKAKPGKPKPRSFYEVVGTQNLPHLESVVDPFYLRRPKALFDASLPVERLRVEDIWLEPAQRKLYKEIWTQQWPGKDGEKMIKIAAIGLAQQALGAPATVGKPEVPSAKHAALLELLTGELRDEKVVVYSKYTGVLEVLRQALVDAKIPHGLITGKLSLQQRDAAVLAFQATGGTRVVLMSDAGGEALDLQAASTLVLYDLPWSFGKLQQIRGRIHRIGSTHTSVLTILLSAVDTVDEDVASLLVKKEGATREVITQGNLATDATLGTLFEHVDQPADLDALFASIQRRVVT